MVSLTNLGSLGGSLLGLGSTLFGGNEAEKAAKARAEVVERAARYQSEQLRALAQPYMEQMNYAMPAFRNLITTSYVSQVGKDNPYLAAGHQADLNSIHRQESSGLANASRYWGLAGNLSRGRGEALRIAQNATEAANAENLGYGKSQMDYRNQASDRFANALSALSRMASPGLGLMTDAAGVQASGITNAAGIRASADEEYWKKLSGLIGGLIRK